MLDLKSLNPSLFVVGLETVELLLPRYLQKAGIACERMQHAQLPVEAIRRVLKALFVVREGETVQAQCYAFGKLVGHFLSPRSHMGFPALGGRSLGNHNPVT